MPGLPQAFDLTVLYAAAQTVLPAGAPLNIEAAATTDTELLQRGLGAGVAAVVLRLPLAAALSNLAGEGPAPVSVTQRFWLPAVDGSPAGFSGATFVEKHLWVTVSVENTADPVRDGAVLGSFVGALDLVADTVDFARFTWADGRAYRGKVEGLTLRGPLPGVRHELLLVTDDDCGGSPGGYSGVRPVWVLQIVSRIRSYSCGCWLWVGWRVQLLAGTFVTRFRIFGSLATTLGCRMRKGRWYCFFKRHGSVFIINYVVDIRLALRFICCPYRHLG